MSVLNTLKFVQGAVAKRDFVPAMTHFEIKNSVVTAYNGQIALSSPIPFDIDCNPKAVELVKAISMCEGSLTMTMTSAGRLKIQSGSFKVFVDCIEGEGLNIAPEGQLISDLDGERLLEAFTTVSPFIGSDASRPWSNGVLIKDQSAFATNNVCLIQYWFGSTFPRVINIPSVAIKEMLRIKEAPISAQLSSNDITFHYSGGRWLRTQLFTTDWPDLSKVLDVQCNNTDMDSSIFDAIKYLKPFVDKTNRLYFVDGIAKTHSDENVGATYKINDISVKGIYNIEMLELLKGVATSIDMTTHPKPCLFFGKHLRGAIIGMRE